MTKCVYRIWQRAYRIIGKLLEPDYLLRDKFLGALAAGSIDGTAADPGPGIRDVNDVENTIYLNSGKLQGAGQDVSPVWGECRLVYTTEDGLGFARTQGRAFAAVTLQLYYRDDWAVLWSESATPGAPDTAGVGYFSDFGLKKITDPSGLAVFDGHPEANTLFQFMPILIQQSTGSYVLMSAPDDSFYEANEGDGTDAERADIFGQIPKFPQARLWWVDRVSVATPLWPTITWYDWMFPAAAVLKGFTMEDVRVVDIADTTWSTFNGFAIIYDTFTEGDGTDLAAHIAEKGGAWTVMGGTWAITGGAAGRTDGAADLQCALLPVPSESAYLVQGQITVPAGVTLNDGIILKYQDNNNFVFYGVSADKWGLYKCVAGVVQLISSKNFPAVPGSCEARCYVSGDTYYCWVNNQETIYCSHDAFIENSPRVGLVSQGNGNKLTFEDLVTFPLTVTLPIELRHNNYMRVIPTAGTVLAQDSFTDGPVDITLHAPEVGPPWTVVQNPAGSFTLDGAGRLGFTNPTAWSWALQELNVTDVECQVEMTFPANAAAMTAGITCYSDLTHWLSVRLIRSDATQPTNVEIEMHHYFTGFGSVAKLVNFGFQFWGNNDVRTLKVQFIGRLVQWWVDGLLSGSYYSPVPLGTRFGLNGGTENGTLYDDWIVRAL